MNADTITILRSRGRRLTKLVKASGEIIGYDDCRLFAATEHDVENIGDLYRALTWLSDRPDRCIVRAAPIDPTRITPMRRLLYADPKTGDDPTLYEAPRFYVATDWDALDRPADVDAADLPACGRAALDRLPAAFRRAGCIVQATGSHGIKLGIRLRLWHWLSRPLNGGEIGRRLGAVEGIDRSVFRPAQIIYTAAPVFETGRDHLPSRIALLPGDDRVDPPSAAALEPPPPRPAVPLPKPGDSDAHKYAFTALRNAAARVASAGIGARHPTILYEARSLARMVAAGLLTTRAVYRALGDAAHHAGKPDGEADAVIEWAMDHPSNVELKVASNG